MTLDTGFGNSPFGGCAFGYGVPYTVTSSVSLLFSNGDGTQGNVPKIDPNLQDFVLDGNGNHVGDKSVNQMVYMALRTQLNSSSVLGFGLDLSSIKTITPNIQLKITASVNAALKSMVQANLIAKPTVNVKLVKPNNALSVYVGWTDLTTKEQNLLKLL